MVSIWVYLSHHVFNMAGIARQIESANRQTGEIMQIIVPQVEGEALDPITQLARQTSAYIVISESNRTKAGNTITSEYTLRMSAVNTYRPQIDDKVVVRGIDCSIYEVDLRSFAGELVEYIFKVRS